MSLKKGSVEQADDLSGGFIGNSTSTIPRCYLHFLNMDALTFMAQIHAGAEERMKATE